FSGPATGHGAKFLTRFCTPGCFPDCPMSREHAHDQILCDSEPTILQCAQPRIESLHAQELLVRAFFDNFTLLNHADLMCRPYRAEPMRDDEDCPPLTNVRHVLLDYGFGFIVESAGRLIKDQNSWVGD